MWAIMEQVLAPIPAIHEVVILAFILYVGSICVMPSNQPGIGLTTLCLSIR